MCGGFFLWFSEFLSNKLRALSTNLHNLKQGNGLINDHMSPIDSVKIALLLRIPYNLIKSTPSPSPPVPALSHPPFSLPASHALFSTTRCPLSAAGMCMGVGHSPGAWTTSLGSHSWRKPDAASAGHQQLPKALQPVVGFVTLDSPSRLLFCWLMLCQSWACSQPLWVRVCKGPCHTLKILFAVDVLSPRA